MITIKFNGLVFGFKTLLWAADAFVDNISNIGFNKSAAKSKSVMLEPYKDRVFKTIQSANPQPLAYAN